MSESRDQGSRAMFRYRPEWNPFLKALYEPLGISFNHFLKLVMLDQIEVRPPDEFVALARSGEPELLIDWLRSK